MQKRVIVAIVCCGALCAVGVGVLAMMVSARKSHMEETQKELDAKEFRPSVTDSVYQLPKVVARSSLEGVLVTLWNDTSDRSIALDSSADRLLLEYEVAGVPLVQSVPVETGALSPRSSRGPVLIPLDGRWRATKVRFQHREPNITAETEAKVP